MKIKNFDRAQYKSDREAIVAILKDNCDKSCFFKAVSHQGFETALYYLCLNDIPHYYVDSKGVDCIHLIIIHFGEGEEEDSYTFWCKMN